MMALNLILRRYSPQARVSFMSFILSSLPASSLLLLPRIMLPGKSTYLIEQWSYINIAIFILVNLVVTLRYHFDGASYGVSFRLT